MIYPTDVQISRQTYGYLASVTRSEDALRLGAGDAEEEDDTALVGIGATPAEAVVDLRVHGERRRGD